MTISMIIYNNKSSWIIKLKATQQNQVPPLIVNNRIPHDTTVGIIRGNRGINTEEIEELLWKRLHGKVNPKEIRD